MLVFFLGLVVVLALAFGVLAVVAVGVGGRHQDTNPKFTSFASRAVRHLNGEAPAPEQFVRVTEPLARRLSQ